MKNLTLALSFLLCCVLSLSAQLKSPNEFLPHTYGEQFTAHHLLVDYFEHVATESDYVQLIEYGRTNEQRPLLLAIVSHPDNLANLSAIQKANLARTGLAEKEEGSSDETAIVWLSFSVHGNEAAGSESSMNVIYQIAKEDSESKKWLKNTVLLIDPSLNPDGYSRYTSWYRNKSGDIVDYSPQGMEHNEPWPGGRVNHYHFDLNRDWAWLTQVESQQRIEKYQEWMPHIHADLHEMFFNSPYYFAPAAQPYHEYITDWQSKFQLSIGKNHAKYFDDYGWLYFTREVFDLFYPSYGDTYPMFNGSIGMTYEQGGHSRAGRGIIRNIGDTLLLADRIAHHTTTALSTLEMGSENAKEIIQEFSQYFEKSMNDPAGDYRTYVLQMDGNQAAIANLTHLLDKHYIKYQWAEKEQKVTGFGYKKQKDFSYAIKRGDLLIPAKQAKGVMAQVLFDPSANLVDSNTYDITAWAMPYAYGIDGIATKSEIKGSDINPFRDIRPATKDAYAYVIPWTSTDCVTFISRLHQKNVRIRLSTEPSTYDDNVKLGFGNLVITAGDNLSRKASLSAIISKASKGLNIEVLPLKSGFANMGPDIGSGSITPLKKPKILLVGGSTVGANSFGHTWHYFDKIIQYPTTIIDAEDMTSIGLENYNILVLPEGRYRNLGESGLNKLKSWIRGGGKLVLIGSANASFSDQEGFSLVSRDRDETEKSLDTDEAFDERLHKFHGRVRRSLSENLPGLVYKIEMDNTHPLGFGLDDQYFSLKTNSLAYPFIENGWNVGYINDEPTLIGFAGSAVQKRLINTSTFATQQMGRGQVVYLIDNPLYRGFWDQGKLLFGNALFLVW